MGGRDFKAVFWDVDNTLVGSDVAFRAARHAAVSTMVANGLPVASLSDGLTKLCALDNLFNPTWYPSLLLLLCFECGVRDEDTSRELVRLGGRAFEAALDRLQPMPGVVDVLVRFQSATVHQGIISNSLGTLQIDRLSRLGLLRYFEPDLILISSGVVDREDMFGERFRDFSGLSAFVEGSCVYRVEKPWLTMFTEAVRRTGCRPAEILYVGDLASDVVGANIAGVASVLFQVAAKTEDRGRRIGLNLERPSFVISRIEQLLEITGLG